MTGVVESLLLTQRPQLVNCLYCTFENTSTVVANQRLSGLMILFQLRVDVAVTLVMFKKKN